jgi:hypothetical protein
MIFIGKNCAGAFPPFTEEFPPRKGTDFIFLKKLDLFESAINRIKKPGN